MYEIYQTTEGRKKTYLVFDNKTSNGEALSASEKFFKVSEDHISYKWCWILNDELYFENPHNMASIRKRAFFWCK